MATTAATILTTTVAAVTQAMTEEELAESDFSAATTVAQVFSGIVFSGLGLWMLISNGTKMSYIQRASLEKRLGTCCAIDTYVALFSAFFNFFQLTEVDDMFLPRPGGFTLDFARPIEWLLTCPMMQIVLVFMGGSRIPEYRRVLMPAISFFALSCATMSMITGDPVRFVFYGIGVCIATTMFTLNAKQIMEHSNGEENLWVGDSEFRKASILLIVTWVPFPMWFFVSPEGIGLIDNILVIQMGWAFLNILSKFTFIFYIQRVKDNYCNRLKVKRELVGLNNGRQNDDEGLTSLAQMMGIAPSPTNPLAQKNKNKENELGAVVIETMSYLGMAQHNDRFIRLLKEAKVSSVEMVEGLSKEESDKLQLPWDLVSALQKRIKVWKMEMTDNAEMELEKGEAHYQASTPRNVDLPGEVSEDQDDVRSQIARTLMGAGAGRYSSSGADFEQRVDSQFAQVADMMNMLQQQVEELNSSQMRRQTEMEGSLVWKIEQMLGHKAQNEQQGSEQLIQQVAERSEAAVDSLGRAVMSKLDSLQATNARQQAENEGIMVQKIGGMMQKTSEAAADALGNALGAKMDMFQTSQLRQQTEMEDSLMQRIQSVVQKPAERQEAHNTAMRQSMEKVEGLATKASQRPDAASESLGQALQAKLDNIYQSTMRKTTEMEASIVQMLESMANSKPSPSPFEQGQEFSWNLQNKMSDLTSSQLRQLEDTIKRKVEDIMNDGITRIEISVGDLQRNVVNDLSTVARGNDVVAETVRTSTDTQKEGLADLRRVSMMVLEQSSAALDKAGSSISKMDLLQGSMDSGLGRIYDRLSDMQHGLPSGATTPPAKQWPTQSGDRRPSDMMSAMGGSMGGAMGGGGVSSHGGSRRPSRSMQVIDG